jgi:hypothetical protein
MDCSNSAASSDGIASRTRFQNSLSVKAIGLKFYMVIVLGKLEDPVHIVPPGTVHKLR